MSINDDHPLIGASYHSLLKTEVDGLRIVGWLPIKQRNQMKNRQGDFDWHFRTVLDERMKQRKVHSGDVLIVVYNSNEYQSGRQAMT